MLNRIKKSYYSTGSAFILGALAMAPDAANASGGGKNFSDISKNITDSITDLPGLLAALSYLFGILLAVLGIMKIKDHVENPSNTPLKEGAIRLLCGGALFAAPIILEAMSTSIGEKSKDTGSAQLKKVKFTTID